MILFSFLPNPVLLLCAGCLVQLGAVAWRRNVARDAVLCVTVLALALASVLFPTVFVMTGHLPLFAADSWASLTSILAIASIIGVVFMLPLSQIGDEPLCNSEYFILLTLVALGAVMMSGATHFVSFFLGLETLSLALLGLIGFDSQGIKAGEAAMKYVLLSGFASAVLIFGFALIYFETGSLYFVAPDFSDHTGRLMTMMGLTLILSGLFFKLSAFPFHLWLADVLQGTSLPVAAVVAVTSKIALFASLVRYFSNVDLLSLSPYVAEISLIAVLSMLGGNLFAVVQKDFRRLLAGSSIAHIGYLLVALLSPGPFGVADAGFYLVAYTVASLGVFAIISGVLPEGGDIRAWHGLFRQKPAVALAMSIMLVSLAGIPPSIGFFAKFFILAAGVSAAHLILALILIVSSVIGLVAYLRVILIMLTPRPERLVTETSDHVHTLSGMTSINALMITGLACSAIALGVYPNLLVSLSQGLRVTQSASPRHAVLYDR